MWQKIILGFMPQKQMQKNVKLAIKQMVKDFKNILEQNSADIVNKMMQE